MRTITASELAQAVREHEESSRPKYSYVSPGALVDVQHGIFLIQLHGDRHSICFNIEPGTGLLLFSHCQSGLKKWGGPFHAARQIARLEAALAISFKVADSQELALKAATPVSLELDPAQPLPPALAIPDHIAAKLYTRFTRLRFGGNYPSWESIRRSHTPEPFSPDRVRQLLAQQNPLTQARWCSEVGHTLSLKAL